IGFKGMGGDAPGPRLPKGRIPPHITKWWVAVLGPGSIGQDCEVSAQFELEGVGKLKLLHASWRRGERQIRECIFISDDGLHYKGEEMGVCQGRGGSEGLIARPGQAGVDQTGDRTPALRDGHASIAAAPFPRLLPS